MDSDENFNDFPYYCSAELRQHEELFIKTFGGFDRNR